MRLLPLILLILCLAACDGDAGTSSIAPPVPEPDLPLAQQLELIRAGQRDHIRVWDALVADTDIAAIAAQPTIVRIVFNNTTLTDTGVAQLAAMPKLETLRIVSAQVTDASLAALAESKTLRHLILVDTPVTDAGLVHLEKLATLESLYLEGTRVTDAGIASLLKQRPTLHVH